MNQVKRRIFILDRIKVKGIVNSKYLAEELNVSLMTINRDLKALSLKGEVDLVYGGAVYKKADLSEYSMTIKKEVNEQGKKEIGKYCKKIVSPSSSVFIETGTTTLAVAQEIFDIENCSFYSNSLLVQSAISKYENISLYSVPGKYRELSQGYLGVQTIDYIKKLKFDIVFIGTEGMSLEGGITLPNEMDAYTKKALINQTNKLVLVIDKSKFNSTYLYKVCDIKEIDLIVTDLSSEDEIFKRIEKITNIISVNNQRDYTEKEA